MSDRRKTLVAHARSLLSEGGPSAITFRALAARAELSVATVSRTFDGVPALLEACLDETYEELIESLYTAIESVDHLPPRDRILSLLAHTLGFARARPEIAHLRYLITAESGLPSRRIETLGPLLDRIASAAGVPPKRVLEARLVGHTLSILIVRYVLHPSDELNEITGEDSLDSVTEHLTRVALRLYGDIR